MATSFISRKEIKEIATPLKGGGVRAAGDQPNLAEQQIDNLMNQIPGEAITWYLILYNVTQNTAALLIWAALGMGLTIFLRRMAKKSTATIVVSSIAFVIWVYVIGGPLQAIGLDVPGVPLGTVLLAVYTLLIQIAADQGWIK